MHIVSFKRPLAEPINITRFQEIYTAYVIISASGRNTGQRGVISGKNINADALKALFGGGASIERN